METINQNNNNDYLTKLYNNAERELKKTEKRIFFCENRYSTIWETANLAGVINLIVSLIATIWATICSIPAIPVLIASPFITFFIPAYIKLIFPNQIFQRCEFKSEFKGKSFKKIYEMLNNYVIKREMQKRKLTLIAEAKKTYQNLNETEFINNLPRCFNFDEEIKQSEENINKLFEDLKILTTQNIIEGNIDTTPSLNRECDDIYDILESCDGGYALVVAILIVINTINAVISSNLLLCIINIVIGTVIAFLNPFIHTIIPGAKEYYDNFCFWKKTKKSLEKSSNKIKSQDSLELTYDEEMCDSYTETLEIDYKTKEEKFLEQLQKGLDLALGEKQEEICNALVHLQQLKSVAAKMKNQEGNNQEYQKVPRIDRSHEVPQQPLVKKR